MKTKVHFSSATDNHATPADYFAKVQAEFGPFDLDPCADSANAKALSFFTKEDDGLSKMWFGQVWMNPPYGRTIGAWMKKAYDSVTCTIDDMPDAELVVCLVPARTDTAWWHNYAMKGEIRFIRGRLKFGGAKNSAPFPSALVIFRNQFISK